MTITTKKYVIGIDPDVEKSGLALLDVNKKNINVLTLTFPELLEFLNDIRINISNTVVYVEAGWHIKTNWHINAKDNRRTASAKGNAAGRNHEVGRKICEMARHYGLEVVEAHPLRKIWKGPDGKITQDEIEYFIPGFPKRTNQEVRDAALLAWHHSGFPIKVRTVKN